MKLEGKCTTQNHAGLAFQGMHIFLKQGKSVMENDYTGQWKCRYDNADAL